MFANLPAQTRADMVFELSQRQLGAECADLGTVIHGLEQEVAQHKQQLATKTAQLALRKQELYMRQQMLGLVQHTKQHYLQLAAAAPSQNGSVQQNGQRS